MSGGADSLLAAYVSAFETLDADAVVPFYHLPCTFLAPGNMFVVSDAVAARALVSHLMEQARSQGYRRTEIRDVKTRQLAADLAALTGVFVRFGEADREILRFGFTYVVRNNAGAWKIAVAVAHDASPGEG